MRGLLTRLVPLPPPDRRSWKCRRKKNKDTMAATMVGSILLLLTASSSEAYYRQQQQQRGGRSVVWRPPLTAVGSSLLHHAPPPLPPHPFRGNPNRVGSHLSFTRGSAWNPETDDTERIKLTLKFAEADGGLILSEASAGSLEKVVENSIANPGSGGSGPNNGNGRRKKRQRPRGLDRQGGCPGRCDNMFRCMLQGGRSGRSPAQVAACPGMFQVRTF